MLSRLYTLLLLLVLACASWAAFGIYSMIVVTSVLVLAGYIRFSGAWDPVVQRVLGACLLLFFIGLLLPAVSSCREAVRRMQCTNNLKQIVLALHNYHHAYGCLPPPYTTDKNGQPIHSWRVLILPFLECQDLYERYDMNAPWNGSHNSKLLNARPSMFVCPADKSTRAGGAATTSYLAVFGKRAIWQGDRITSLDSPALHGKLEDSVILIETADSGIQWTEPKDFCLDELGDVPSTDSASEIQIPHMRDNGYCYDETPYCLNMAFADRSWRPVYAETLKTEKLKRLLEVGGFTQENAADLGADKQEPQLNWPHCIGLPVWLISVGLLLYQAVRGRKPRPEVANSCP
jgi:hypothetical protein